MPNMPPALHDQYPSIFLKVARKCYIYINNKYINCWIIKKIFLTFIVRKPANAHCFSVSKLSGLEHNAQDRNQGRWIIFLRVFESGKVHIVKSWCHFRPVVEDCRRG